MLSATTRLTHIRNLPPAKRTERVIDVWIFWVCIGWCAGAMTRHLQTDEKLMSSLHTSQPQNKANNNSIIPNERAAIPHCDHHWIGR